MSVSFGWWQIWDPTRKKPTDDVGAVPPYQQISNVQVSLTGSTAVVTWTTSLAASSRVSYGVVPNLDNSTAEQDVFGGVTTSHSVTITGLNPDEVYLFRVHSRQLGGTDGQYNRAMDGYDVTADGSFVTTGVILQEDGSYVLQEDGTRVSLEQ